MKSDFDLVIIGPEFSSSLLAMVARRAAQSVKPMGSSHKPRKSRTAFGRALLHISETIGASANEVRAMSREKGRCHAEARDHGQRLLRAASHGCQR
jgi:hypothetical protein